MSLRSSARPSSFSASFRSIARWLSSRRAHGDFDKRHPAIKMGHRVAGSQPRRFAKRVFGDGELLLLQHHKAERVIDSRLAVVYLARAFERFERFGVFTYSKQLPTEREIRVEVFIKDADRLL